MTSSKDQKLGMDRDITRRDFLNGVNIAVSGSLLSAPLTSAMTESAIEQGFRATQEILYAS